MPLIDPAPVKVAPKQPVVLVVDDNEMARMMLSFIVSEQGFEVRTAASGWEAVDVYAKEAIDLVLLDVVMPGIDGPKTLEILKARAPRVCCCFATAGTGSYSDGDLAERGAAWVFKKPFSAPEIGEVLQRLLHDTPRPAETAAS
jgi:CheY-like chemotaxis protein